MIYFRIKYSLSNMIFRIFGLDDNDNVIIVADQDIANVNHSKLDKFYQNLLQKNNFW